MLGAFADDMAMLLYSIIEIQWVSEALKSLERFGVSKTKILILKKVYNGQRIEDGSKFKWMEFVQKFKYLGGMGEL